MKAWSTLLMTEAGDVRLSAHNQRGRGGVQGVERDPGCGRVTRAARVHEAELTALNSFLPSLLN